MGTGKRDFYDRLKNRKITVSGTHLDCGCTACADIWDEDSEDFEYVDWVDVSCLEIIT